ncbi:dihydrofolate reductase family protein [Sphaerisporangium dianthi]|uniref:Dihydrofolate reductase family protein n=1 Tax=Sphaerisporangium dianthi TaxID=1436120 RepID=A0ABV9CRV4_9ACTN
MRNVVVSTFVTLDAIQDNPHEWSMEYWTDEYAGRARDQLFAADALLMGRVTYEGFAAAWPSRNDEGTAQEGFADRINTMPKYVVSTTLDTVGWTGSTLVKGDLAEAVRELKAQPGQDILMYGCGEVARALAAQGLVDEFRFWIHPVVAGRGEPVFAGWPQSPMRLLGVTTLESGVVIVSHAPVR